MSNLPLPICILWSLLSRTTKNFFGSSNKLLHLLQFHQHHVN
jgi:hypothetical protein